MKINNSYILLKDICCFAYHGVAPQENIIGNEYIINLKLKVDISQAIQTDDVVDTVNYAEIHEAVKAEMSIPSNCIAADKYLCFISLCYYQEAHWSVILSSGLPHPVNLFTTPYHSACAK